MTAHDFIPAPYSRSLEQGSFCWSSPSNIALIKYWGKKEIQIPANPSISFTLEESRTLTTLKYDKKKNDGTLSFEVYFEKEKNDDFRPKIEAFFKRVQAYIPFLADYHFTIETSNTFPHSSGIASSASGMSALSLCLMSMERELNPEISEEFFNKKASFLARLGSGSACRSIDGNLVVWGRHDEIEGSNDLFGLNYPLEVHPRFNNYQDTILLVDEGEKVVSSTIGHELMHDHPFAEQRFRQAGDNLTQLVKVFKSGDLDTFVKTIESEALSLHAMMLTSTPSYILMMPNTLEIINRIRSFRERTGLPVCFTLDAGANVHILYPDSESDQIFEFIKNELVAFCQNGRYICDRIGFGAKQLPI